MGEENLEIHEDVAIGAPVEVPEEIEERLRESDDDDELELDG